MVYSAEILTVATGAILIGCFALIKKALEPKKARIVLKSKNHKK